MTTDDCVDVDGKLCPSSPSGVTIVSFVDTNCRLLADVHSSLFVWSVAVASFTERLLLLLIVKTEYFSVQK